MKKLLVLTVVLGFGSASLAYSDNTKPVSAGPTTTITSVASRAIATKKPRYLNGHHPKGRKAITRKPVKHIAPVMVSPTAN
jgi:hypothetical protein